MASFNLCQRASRMVFLDDDPLFLDVLSMAFPSHWRTDLFSDTKSCIDFLQLNSVIQKCDLWRRQEILLQARQGGSVIALMLKYWQQHPERYDIVEMAVFDYAMPGLNGIQALERLRNWEGQRALLTGQADEVIAVAAFNAGTIQQFIPKQSSGLRANLIAQLQPMLDKGLAQHQLMWRQGFEQAQLEWLSEPPVAANLRQWLASKDCVEYVVTAAPFGVLMVSRSGNVSWLQLESATHLDDVADLVSEEMPQSVLSSIAKGEALPNVELSMALGGDLPFQINPAFKVCDSLLAVSYDLGEKYNIPPEKSYNAWCEKHAGNSHFRIWRGAQSANPKA
ncbi:MAG: hypothetical protein RL761_663 [Pseudomonadota bacterium]